MYTYTISYVYNMYLYVCIHIWYIYILSYNMYICVCVLHICIRYEWIWINAWKHILKSNQRSASLGSTNLPLDQYQSASHPPYPFLELESRTPSSFMIMPPLLHASGEIISCFKLWTQTHRIPQAQLIISVWEVMIFRSTPSCCILMGSWKLGHRAKQICSRARDVCWPWNLSKTPVHLTLMLAAL